VRHIGQCRPQPLELWDNDGIVNTNSMLWPTGENVLVAGDHLDIVGHYKLVEAERGSGRKYQSYDSLKSMPQFTGEMFQNIWTEIFNFCSGHSAGRRHAAKMPSRWKRLALPRISKELNHDINDSAGARPRGR